MKITNNLPILDRIILLIHTNRQNIGTYFSHFDYDKFEKELIEANNKVETVTKP